MTSGDGAKELVPTPRVHASFYESSDTFPETPSPRHLPRQREVGVFALTLAGFLVLKYDQVKKAKG